MKHSISLGLIAIALFSGFSKNDCNQEVLIEISGDLDKDKISERIVVTELDEEGEYGKVRLLEIFKKEKRHWILWQSSKTAILGSEGGGMMGDPFFDKMINIKDGVITIDQNGGSSWKWGTTHKYRFQNGEFELIGYSTEYGKMCEYWAKFDFNLSSGKAIYEKEHETCDDATGDPISIKVEKEAFIKKLKKLPNLRTINTSEVKFSTPKYKEEISF